VQAWVSGCGETEEVEVMIFLTLLIFSTSYDDDTTLDFVWEPSKPEELVDHYEVWVSKNGSKYKLLMTVKEPRCSFKAEDGAWYRVKVRAVSKDGKYSEFSDPSDVVVVRVVYRFEFEDGVKFEMRYSKRKRRWELKLRGRLRTYRKWWASKDEIINFADMLKEAVR